MNQTPTPLVRIEGLIKTYGKTRALHGLSLDIAPGRIIGLVGENGCGKTTLMKILAGVLAEWQGRVEINGRAPGPETKAEIAFLPCADFLDTSLNAEKVIALYERFFADFDADKARRTIDYFGLPKDRTLKEMSRGMGQKLQIFEFGPKRTKTKKKRKTYHLSFFFSYLYKIGHLLFCY